MEYAVVRFVDDTYSEIPIKWLIDDDTINDVYCWWPPSNIKNISSVIRRKDRPNPATWQKHRVDVVEMCSTLERARKVAEESESEEPESRGKGCRKKFPSTKCVVSEEESCGDSSPRRNAAEYDEAWGMLDSPPAFPNAVRADDMQCHQMSADDKQSDLGRNQDGASTSYKEKLDVQNNNTDAVTKKWLLEQFQLISRNLIALDIRVQELAQAMKQPYTTTKTDSISKLIPFDTFDECVQFDDKIKNGELADEFRSYVRRIGGRNAEDHLRQVLRKIFTTKFAADHTWKGRKNNKNVSQLKFIQIMKGSLLDMYPLFTEIQIEKQGIEWFRLGRQRENRK